ncbi:hypothetical protein M407DRAFT_33668 [Tulasnella calospora MUT 4182]|uniref:Glycosyltransferase family 1 protein n=1 Tax=Tulasnella calospora MUT 4182 TaxID=1051891 RepID=A0A0C3K5K5_9AGAM|nr:hypothetical protein M407DRAFT_33668 [Tulasnella calospora MUT 4182]
MLGSTPGQAQITLSLITFLFIVSLADCYPSRSTRSPDHGPDSANAQKNFNIQKSPLPVFLSFDSPSPFLRRHVAISTSFARSELYGPLAWIADMAMTKYAAERLPTSLKIYSMRSGHQFGTLPRDIIRPSDQLARDIRSATLYEDDAGAMIDLVILGSCEADLERFGPDLLKAWDERPHNKKFMLTCGVHNDQTTDWFKYIPEWSRCGSLRVIPMSNHIIDYFHSMFKTFADQTGVEAQHQSPYKYIKTDVPCSAVLQDDYQQERMNYERIFHDLTRLLREDSQGWGYSWSAQERKYVADNASLQPPFVFHLIGAGEISVPSELQGVVVKNAGLDTSFYELSQSIDLVVPAFLNRECRRRQASSAVYSAAMSHIPLLTTQDLLKCYPHLTSEGVILRPSTISEMEAIGLFRGAKVNGAQITEVSKEGRQSPIRFNDHSVGLDVSSELAEDSPSAVVFTSLKHHWQVVRNAREQEMGLPIQKEDFILLYSTARTTTLTPQIIVEAFRKTGTYPINRAAVSEEQMAPSTETALFTSFPADLASPIKAVLAANWFPVHPQTLSDGAESSLGGELTITSNNGISDNPFKIHDPSQYTLSKWAKTMNFLLEKTSASFLAKPKGELTGGETIPKPVFEWPGHDLLPDWNVPRRLPTPPALTLLRELGKSKSFSDVLESCLETANAQLILAHLDIARL